MRTVVINRNGGPDVLELEDRPVPKPGRGQLCVDVAAAGVNYRDVYEREGTGGYGGPPPILAGIEGAGRVSAIGDDVEGFAVGDRVAWMSAAGSYAEQVLVTAAKTVKVPAGLAPETAAAAMMQGITAQYLATSCCPVHVGDTVLIHAAAGGVGGLLTQVVKLLGGHVIATASSEEKRAAALANGAGYAIDYPDFAGRVLELTGGQGVEVVFDGVGAATVDGSLACLKPRGTLVLTGTASGPVPSIDVGRMAAKALFFTRPGLAHYTASADELNERAAAVFGWIASGALKVRIGGRFALDYAREAHRALEARRTLGKLVLLPGPGRWG
ncbi:MAG: quinone oxidoreductase [Isosphaeraceae bacterium]|nr:quinone oxidoreductase [Isosphaeraceae bacterium]